MNIFARAVGCARAGAQVLLRNLLIAMMGRTFADDADDTHRMWV